MYIDYFHDNHTQIRKWKREKSKETKEKKDTKEKIKNKVTCMELLYTNANTQSIELLQTLKQTKRTLHREWKSQQSIKFIYTYMWILVNFFLLFLNKIV